MSQDRYLPPYVRLIFSSAAKRKFQRAMSNVPSDAPRSFWRKLVRTSIEVDAGANGAGVLCVPKTLSSGVVVVKSAKDGM